jgi:6-phosphogluconolactonase
MKFEYSVFEDAAAVAREAAEDFKNQFLQSVKERGAFRVLLSGGKTPKAFFYLLAQPGFKDLPWSEASFFWGDERCVPHNHPESNYRSAREVLFSKVPVVGDRIYPAPVGGGDPIDEASKYENILRKAFESSKEEFPTFDYALMGLGPDGHTASIFPDGEAIKEGKKWVVPAYNENHAVRSRLTMTLPVFNNVRHAVFLICGSEKKQKASEMLDAINKEKPPVNFPAALIRPKNGRLVYFLDRAAAPASE